MGKKEPDSHDRKRGAAGKCSARRQCKILLATREKKVSLKGGKRAYYSIKDEEDANKESRPRKSTGKGVNVLVKIFFLRGGSCL